MCVFRIFEISTNPLSLTSFQPGQVRQRPASYQSLFQPSTGPGRESKPWSSPKYLPKYLVYGCLYFPYGNNKI